MKKPVLCLLGLVSTVSLAVASDNFTYTATAAPGSTPDGVDQNSTPVDVWQITLSATGGRGTEYSTFGNLTDGWGEYSYPSGTPSVSGSVDATTAFAGGDLAIGQTVSIDFLNRAVNTGDSVGVSLLDGSISDIMFSYTGGDPTGVYRYTDASVSGQSTGLSFAYQSAIDLSFTLTSATTYSATASDTAGSESWDGTYSGSISGIDVYNHAGGDGSDVLFNDLSVVPEPSTWAMLGIGGVALLGYRRGFKATV
jgi:hypothetical protein